MNRLMIDVVSFGSIKSNSVIDNVTAAFFNEKFEIGELFHTAIAVQAQLDMGRTIDADKLLNAPSNLSTVPESRRQEPRVAMSQLSYFIKNKYFNSKLVRVWHSSTHHVAVLRDLFHMVQVDAPWMLINERCVNTIVSMHVEKNGAAYVDISTMEKRVAILKSVFGK